MIADLLWLGVALDHVEVTVEAQIDQRAGAPGHDVTLREPHGITYTVHVQGAESDEALCRVHQAVERLCPILNLLRNPQAIRGSFWRPPANVEAFS